MRSTFRFNILLSLLTVLFSVPVLALFDQVSGGRGTAGALISLGGAWAVGFLVLWVLLRRGLRPLSGRKKMSFLGPAELLPYIFRLPRVVSKLHLLTWLGVGLTAAVASWVIERFRPDLSFLVFLVCLLAGLGAALTALVKTSKQLAPLSIQLAREAAESGIRVESVRTPLREKIMLILGGVVFFTSAFGLFSSFALQREISAWYAQVQGGEVATAVMRQAGSWSEGCRAADKLVPHGGGLAWSYRGKTCVLGEALDGVEVGSLLEGPEGMVSVPSSGLDGVRRVFPGLTVAVLFPKPEWARRVLLVSLIFYTLLFAFSAWLAAQVARDLTLPIDELSAQVKKIESGDLSQVVVPLSADEIGDLSQAIESMRKGLSEMVDTIRSLNLTLEEKVRIRTQELEETLAQLKNTQAQLVHSEKMASLGRLMSGLAHELNNPVNAIMNSARPLKEGLEMLAASSADVTVRKLARAARVVETAAMRMVELLTSFSRFSRPDESARKPVDVNAALSATLMLLQHRLDAAGIMVEKLNGELPSVMGIPGEINQVLMNLITNAIEAVIKKGAEGRIRIETRAEKGWVVIEVTDNGPGIPRENIERIFEPFFTTKEKGTGLGLAICHEIVQRHEGSILVESEPGNGAKFTVRLPAVGNSCAA